MVKNGMDVVGYLILDAIQQNGDVDDFALAGQLHCTRSFLLSKLEYLWSEDYLIHTPEGYQLSEKGREARIPLTIFENLPENAATQAELGQSYDWTALYIPPAGWMD